MLWDNLIKLLRMIMHMSEIPRRADKILRNISPSVKYDNKLHEDLGTFSIDRWMFEIVVKTWNDLAENNVSIAEIGVLRKFYAVHPEHES